MPVAHRSFLMQKILCWVGIIPFTISAAIFIPALMSDLITGNYTTTEQSKLSALQNDSLVALSDNPHSQKPTELGALIGAGICMGIVPGILTFLLIVQLRKINRLEKKHNEVYIQDRLLELAQKHNGKLTIVETATELDIAVSDAQTLLENLCRIGMAQLQVSESGTLVYHVTDIISKDEKDRSETV